MRLTKKNEAIKYKIIRDITTLFDSEKEDYYKPVMIDNVLSNNYIA